MLHVIQGYVTRDTSCHIFDGLGIKGPAEHDVACEQIPDWVIGSKRNQERGVPTAVSLCGGRARREPVYRPGRHDLQIILDDPPLGRVTPSLNSHDLRITLFPERLST